MLRLPLLLFASLSGLTILAQDSLKPADEAWKQEYRSFATKINDLVHTRLDVRFDYDKSYLYGKAWITLKPHYYPTDTPTLDAKGMGARQVSLARGNQLTKLKYDYDGLVLRIRLDRSYRNSEQY